MSSLALGLPLRSIQTKDGTSIVCCSPKFVACCKSPRPVRHPYHPASNGQAKRFNRTLLQMMQCYVDQNQRIWMNIFPYLLRRTEAQVSATGFMPNQLILGQEVFQPHDIWLSTAEVTRDAKATPEFVQKLQDNLQQAHQVARQNLRSAQTRHKKIYDL
ncbi:hypothetical protein QQF64_036140 [Cirrhinus molitorella]|uniref:Integrase catalytic domain-containing protein n=1 Tax=Cirrhinus molitorella TaxID=172907 RepID=A0ABR3NI23_9TELE